MKRSAQIITFLSSKIGLWFNAIRARWNQTQIQFSWVESRFSKVSAKLNTDETILMAGTEYFGQTAVQPSDHIPVNTIYGNHTITHFRSTDETIHNHA